MSTSSDNRETQLARRLLAFGPQFDVFEVNEREIAGGGREPKLMAELLPLWPDAPSIFREKAEDTDFLSLGSMNRSGEGCNGSRSNLPLPRNITGRQTRDYERIVQEAKDSGFGKIALVYPDRIEEDRLIKLSYMRQFSQDLRDAAAKENVNFNLFPVYKTNSRRHRTNPKSLRKDSIGIGVTLQFWSPETPPQDAAIVVFDDNVHHGRTIISITSFLMSCGVPEDNIRHIVVPLGLAEFNTTDSSKQISEFRSGNPIIAAQCDIMLDMMGVGGLKGLSPQEWGVITKKTIRPDGIYGVIGAELALNIPVMEPAVTPGFLDTARARGILKDPGTKGR